MGNIGLGFAMRVFILPYNCHSGGHIGSSEENHETRASFPET